ncbi:fasciclin domain-containing protein [Gordonia sp. ABSL11-1]|uniref:fasciclin domain-containing protein n=1 Tax=Gordonia sp. ABSL11-1 TaxID=3053924 RepID=UPI00257364BF|nr:fasciclin domain-containing protein [Gordonia sp. ABSL11-1]MDL9946954.1 fasciclin domain-containing protein [Gordonia sp. ABSL11-1]
MALKRTHRILTLASGVALTIGLVAGCSSDDSSDSASSASSMAPMSGMQSSTMESGSDSASTASGLVGPGCAAYAEANPSGPASVDGMAMAPVATAAAANPTLKTLTQAVSGQLNPEVNLVDTLNNGEYTVFAPTDDAFAKLPPETVDQLKTDKDLLTKILTYHVVSGQVAPDAIAGEHKTLEGQNVNVTGSGDNLKANESGVVCGGVKTANATVYLIDTVMMPPAM